MKKAKVILIIVILLLALIVSLQNTEAVDTKFLLMTDTASVDLYTRIRRRDDHDKRHSKKIRQVTRKNESGTLVTKNSALKRISE